MVIRWSLLTIALVLAMAPASADSQQPNIKPRIVAGSEASRLPAGMVSIQQRSMAPEGGRAGHVCGGALIRPRWVLTAAHCVDDRSEQLDVFLGSRNLGAKSPERRPVVARYIHPQYSRRYLENDIALLYLGWNSTQRLAPVAASTPQAGQLAQAYGWGARRLDLPTFLQQAELRLIDHPYCQFWSDSILCARADQPDTTVCLGDSGSPLYHQGQVIGLVSFSGAHPYRCRHSDFPSGFTSVVYHRQWIDQQLAEPPQAVKRQRLGNPWARYKTPLMFGSFISVDIKESQPLVWLEVASTKTIKSAQIVLPRPGGQVCTVSGINSFELTPKCSTVARLPLEIANGGYAAGTWIKIHRSCQPKAYFLVTVGKYQYREPARFCAKG